MAVARNTSHTDDLTGAQRQVQVGQALHAQAITHRDACGNQQRLTRRCAGLPFHPAHVHLTSHHGQRQGLHRGLGNGQLLHNAATAHHGHVVAQAHDLLELVGDEQNGAALVAQHPQHVEQLLGFLRREYGSGLIQDQNTGAAVQRLQDFKALTVPDRQVLHQRVQVNFEPGTQHQGIQTHTHLPLGTPQRPVRLGAKHNVVQRTQGVDQHEMLVNHANAQCNRVVGMANDYRPAKYGDLPAVSRVKTVQHRHQRAFAGAVFTHDAVHRASAHGQAHVIIGQHSAKALADARHLNRGFNHHSAFRQTGAGAGSQALCGISTCRRWQTCSPPP